MARVPHDPYGDFAARVMNSIRVALRNTGGMNETEHETVKAILDLMVELDPACTAIASADIIIRRR